MPGLWPPSQGIYVYEAILIWEARTVSALKRQYVVQVDISTLLLNLGVKNEHCFHRWGGHPSPLGAHLQQRLLQLFFVVCFETGFHVAQVSQGSL